MRAAGAILAMGLLQGGEGFKYDAWEAWNSFKVGSMVELEYETASGRSTRTSTIEGKTEKSVTLATVSKSRLGDKDVEAKTTETVLKDEAAPGERACAACTKIHRKDVKEGKAKLTVAGTELECVLVEKTLHDCDGKPSGKWRGWYHKDVPGWVVRMESVVDDTRYVTMCTRFVKK